MVFEDAIYQYCEAHSSLPNEVLPALERQTNLRTMQPHMISGQLQGQLLTMFARLTAAKVVLDIGTFTGYSAICLAAGLAADGVVHTIDIDEEKSPLVNEFIEASGFRQQIKTHLGEALSIIPTLDVPFDVVFIDADKENYAAYFDAVIDKMRSGGLIIADNVLWKGKILNENKDKKTSIIDDFNKKINTDARVENLLLPIRDGLMVARVK
jgi:predicted O-methyltransferase YrrM